MTTPVHKNLNLAVFISGRGSNMTALMDACVDADFPADIAVVVSNTPDAGGLEIARAAAIPVCVVNHKDFDTKRTFEDALLAGLAPYGVDLICLAGFMRLLSPHFLDNLDCDIINIHPSLLPAYKGLNTHARALSAGETTAGCTVHRVIADMDAGEVLVQKTVDIMNGDTPKTLAARVLEQEHIAYPEAVRLLAAAK